VLLLQPRRAPSELGAAFEIFEMFDGIHASAARPPRTPFPSRRGTSSGRRRSAGD
jgi:hypothetical protein